MFTNEQKNFLFDYESQIFEGDKQLLKNILSRWVSTKNCYTISIYLECTQFIQMRSIQKPAIKYILVIIVIIIIAFNLPVYKICTWNIRRR